MDGQTFVAIIQCHTLVLVTGTYKYVPGTLRYGGGK